MFKKYLYGGISMPALFVLAALGQGFVIRAFADERIATERAEHAPVATSTEGSAAPAGVAESAADEAVVESAPKKCEPIVRLGGKVRIRRQGCGN